MRRIVIPEGHELSGCVLRLYPSAEQVEKLHSIQRQTKYVWNCLVSLQRQAWEAREAACVRAGIVGPRPKRPDYDAIEGNDAKVEAKEAYHQMCKVRTQTIRATMTKEHYRSFEELKVQFEKQHVYQVFSLWNASHLLENQIEEPVKVPAHVWQALEKAFYSKGKKQIRKKDDPMPLQVGSGVCIEFGDFGRKGFHDCQVNFPCVGRIPGRLGKGRYTEETTPWLASSEARILEGVTITEEPGNRWRASIKVVRPKRKLLEVVPGSIVGIDVGLIDTAAIASSVHPNSLVHYRFGTPPTAYDLASGSIDLLVNNPRGREFSERIAGRQALDLPVGKMQRQAKRNTDYLLYQIVAMLAPVETIVVEKLTSKVGSGWFYKSTMRSLVKLLQDRYGSRVVEVDPRLTSQNCSQCGHRDKEAWKEGRSGTCPACGHHEHRDINAARNLIHRFRERSGDEQKPSTAREGKAVEITSRSAAE